MPFTGPTFTLGSLLAGERNPDDDTNGYIVVQPEATAVRFDGVTTQVPISNGAPAILASVIANAGSTGNCTIYETGNAVPKFVLDVAEGRSYQINARLQAGLEVQGEASADFTFVWRPV